MATRTLVIPVWLRFRGCDEGSPTAACGTAALRGDVSISPVPLPLSAHQRLVDGIGRRVRGTATVRLEGRDGDLTGPAPGSKQLRRITPDEGTGGGVARASGEPRDKAWMDDRADST